MKWITAGVHNKTKNRLNKKLLIYVLPTFIGCIGIKNKNLNPNFILPFTTVAKIYITKTQKNKELINLAIENSKNTKTLFKNSEWGIESFTTNL